MCRLKSFIILLFSIILLEWLNSDSILDAQNISVQNKSGFSKYLSTPFDSSLNQLNRNFLGHNLKEIYNKLQSRTENSKVKSEFETTEQFQKRKDEEIAKPIVGKIFMENNLAFLIRDCPSIYNADKGSLKVICPFANTYDLKQSCAVQWKLEIVKDDSYIGTNAFGVTMKVNRQERKYYSLVVANCNKFEIANIPDSYGISRSGLSANITLGIAEAKIFKSKISAVLVCKLQSPYHSYNWNFAKARFDFPYEENDEFRYLHISVLQLWFVDMSTGKVVFKINADKQE